MTTQSSESESLSHVPAYIGERSRQAREAGLALERQVTTSGVLSTWYVGSEAQIRAAPLIHVPEHFVFPSRVGARRVSALRVFSPAAPRAELKCALMKLGEDRFRVAIVNEIMPVAWRVLSSKIDVYKYCELREGGNTGPATVYVGPFPAMQAAGIAPAEAERETVSDQDEDLYPWQSQPLASGRHRFVVFHEAEAKARAQDEERGRSNFTTPEQYQDWLREVVAASVGMIRRQLRVKTKQRYVYTVPARTLRELEAHFQRLRKAIARTEIVVQKEDVRAEEQRARLRDAGLAAMRDRDFQRFLTATLTALPGKKR